MAGFVTGFLVGLAMFVLVWNIFSWALVAGVSSVFLLGAFLLNPRFGFGMIFGGVTGFVLSFMLAFGNPKFLDRDFWTSLIGLGPSDTEWIQKADKRGIHLPRDAKHIRFDDRSGLFISEFSYHFVLEPEAVQALRRNGKLNQSIEPNSSEARRKCQPQNGFWSRATSTATEKLFDITAVNAGWLEGGGNITLEIHQDGSAHGCAHVVSTR